MNPGIRPFSGPLSAAPADTIIAGSSAGLIISNNGTTRIDVVADEVLLRDSEMASFRAAGFGTITIDPASVGVNRLDTGAGTIGWYYVWLISNGSTVGGLMSLSSTAPTLPGGYTYKALIGAVYINFSPIGFQIQYQLGRTAYLNQTNLFTAKVDDVGADYDLLAGADLTTFQSLVPPIAKTVFGIFGSDNSQNAFIAIAADANGLGAGTCIGSSPGNFNSFSVAAPFQVPLKTPQNFYWKCGDTTARNRIDICGYTI